ncbi:MAG: hypothetical protein C0622_01205 [Desulfuromonas sp.]|nr:MAG: hypothetical protein C0622_01205 [Desulfuromonas sp.]
MKFQLIENIVVELNEQIGVGRIAKIYQPDPELIVIKIWTGRENIKLLISVEAAQGGIHLTERAFLNPSRPPRFCQLLRARITRILKFEVVNEDRIVFIHCHGPQGEYRLVVELIGRGGNMILVDSAGRIIDALKRVQGENGHRSLIAGKPYIFPPVRENSDGDRHSEVLEKPSGISWNQFADQPQTKASASQDFFQQLLRTLGAQIKKLSKRLSNIEAELAAQEDYQRHKQGADLLLANLHLLKRGMTSIALIDYYRDPPEEVEIPLDPLLTPQQNVEASFKRFKKLKRGIEHSLRRVDETRSELSWLEQLEFQLKDDSSGSTLEEVAEELRAAGLLREVGTLRARRTSQSGGPLEGRSPSGYRVLVGRNNRQNDELSTRLLKTGDLWFHVHNAPGAHVVLKCGQQREHVTETDLRYAAELAAGYSRLKNDSKVEVIQTEGGAVHKPKGGKPGLVNVLRYSTIVVQPKRLAD